MFVNYGDRDFFEYGVLVDTEHSDTVFPMLLCRPYADEEALYQFAHVEVDISDEWIDRPAVMACIGKMADERIDPVEYAIACADFYSWDNFGAASFGVYYDWRHMTRDQVEKELLSYLIADDEPETARWIWDANGNGACKGAWVCSRCFTPNANIRAGRGGDPLRDAGAKFCPECGAKITGFDAEPCTLKL